MYLTGLIVVIIAYIYGVLEERKWTIFAFAGIMIFLFPMLGRMVSPVSPEWVGWCYDKILIVCWTTLCLWLIYVFKKDDWIVVVSLFLSFCVFVLFLAIAVSIWWSKGNVDAHSIEAKGSVAPQVGQSSSVALKAKKSQSAPNDVKLSSPTPPLVVSSSSLDSVIEKYEQYQKQVKDCLDAPRDGSTINKVQQLTQQGQELMRLMKDSVSAISAKITDLATRQSKLNEQKSKINSMQVRDRTETFIEQMKVEAEGLVTQKSKLDAYLIELEKAGKTLAEYRAILDVAK